MPTAIKAQIFQIEAAKMQCSYQQSEKKSPLEDKAFQGA
jgi:hypothetical protein